MTLKIRILVSLLLVSVLGYSQQVGAVYKIDDLLKRIDNNSDTVYIVNFWATWCMPCVKELPSFDSTAANHKNDKLKILLVSLDFKEDMKLRVDPFLKKHNYKMECVLLDEVNGNDFIDKIDKKWSGAIPATFATTKRRSHTFFAEKKLSSADLEEVFNKLK